MRLIAFLGITILLLSMNIPTIFCQRHSEVLQDIVSKRVVELELFLEWLNQTGLITWKSRDLEEYFKVFYNESAKMMRIAKKVLNEVYRNATLTIFIGGIQLRVLKSLAKLEDVITENDTLLILDNIRRAIYNDTSALPSCENPIAKLETNLFFRPMGISCRYSLSDIDSVISLIFSLRSIISEKVIGKVLNDLAIIRESILRGRINEEFLIHVKNTTALRYSLVIALFIIDVSKANNLKILQNTPSKSISKRVESDKTEEIVKLVVAIEKLRKLKGLKNIDIQTIIKIANELGIDVEHVNLDRVLHIIEALEMYEKAYSYEYGEITSETIAKTLERLVRIKSSITSYQLIFEEQFIEQSEAIFINRSGLIEREYNAPSPRRGVAKQESGYSVTDPVLSEILHIVNNMPITKFYAIESKYKDIFNVERKDRYITHSMSSQEPLKIIYVAPLVVLLVFLIVKSYGYLYSSRTILKESKIIKKLNYRGCADILAIKFWNVIMYLAQLLGIEIYSWETHREALYKISKILKDKKPMLVFKLLDIAKIYEKVRFGKGIEEKAKLLAIEELDKITKIVKEG